MRLHENGNPIGWIGRETFCFHARCEARVRAEKDRYIGGFRRSKETQWEFGHEHGGEILKGNYVCNGCGEFFSGAQQGDYHPEAMHFL